MLRLTQKLFAASKITTKIIGQPKLFAVAPQARFVSVNRPDFSENALEEQERLSYQNYPNFDDFEGLNHLDEYGDEFNFPYGDEYFDQWRDEYFAEARQQIAEAAEAPTPKKLTGQ